MVKELKLSKTLLAILILGGSLLSMLPLASAESTVVETGYPDDGIEDLIWAAEYLGYENPAAFQKAGVQVLRFLLVAIAKASGDDCKSDFSSELDPSGPNKFETTWSEEEIDALEWISDYYCLENSEAQMLGGSALTFLAKLEANAAEDDVEIKSEIVLSEEKLIEAEKSVTPVSSNEEEISLQIFPGNESVRLKWELHEDLESDDTKYTIRYKQTFPALHDLITTPEIPGRILFMSDRDGDFELYSMDTDSTNLVQITNNEVDDWSGVFSRDGKRIAFDANHDGDGDIFVVDVDGSNLKKLTNNFAEDAFPTWSPDGKQIVFERKINNTFRLHIMNSDGSKLRLLNEINTGHWSVPEWSPIDDLLVFTANIDGDSEIYLLNLETEMITQVTDNEGVNDRWPAWSPDGKSITFVSDSDGDWEVFTISLDGTNRRQVTQNEGIETEPAWSSDGEWITFTRPIDGLNDLGLSQDEVFIVSLDGEETFGPIAVGEQPQWAPLATEVDTVTKNSSRSKQIVGSEKPSVTPFIVGADEELNADYSYQVALLESFQSGAYYNQYCGGALIDPEWVLTAAHCLLSSTDGYMVPSQLAIAVGRTKLSTIGSSDYFKVDTLYPHPQYDGDVKNDIALLHLTRPVPSGMAVPIPWLEDATEPKDDASILKTGWGSTDLVGEGPYPDELKATVAKVVGNYDYDFCGSDTQFIAMSRICSDSIARKGACSGDSGGPNVVAVDGSWFLAGITSYGMTDSSNRCADDVDVLTRVSHYSDWITDHVGWQWTWISGLSEKEYVVEKLKTGVSYIFQIRAEGPSVNTPYSRTKMITLDTPKSSLLEVPKPPTNVTAVGGEGEVLIKWDYLDDKDGITFSIQHYESSEKVNTERNLTNTNNLINQTTDRLSSAEKMIIGGKKADFSSNSHIVALLTPGVSDATEARFCAGTLITEMWVVTAAHCVDGGTTASQIEVSAGFSDLGSVNLEDRIRVDEIHVHEGYRASPLTHDIALIKLSASLAGTKTASWIPWLEDIKLPLDGTELKTSGWGSTVAGEKNKEQFLLEAPGFVISNPGNDRCGEWSTFDSFQWLCVGGEQNVGTCSGDGGGPVTTGVGLQELIGIVAWGPSKLCADTRLPNVAVRISTYKNWIEARVGKPWRHARGITWQSHAVKSLKVGQEYTFYVKAIDRFGRSSEAIPVTATVTE